MIFGEPYIMEEAHAADTFTHYVVLRSAAIFYLLMARFLQQLIAYTLWPCDKIVKTTEEVMNAFLDLLDLQWIWNCMLLVLAVMVLRRFDIRLDVRLEIREDL